MFCKCLCLCKYSKFTHGSNTTHICMSEKLSVSLIYFNSHNRNRAVFVTDAVAVAVVVISTSICGSGFAVVRFYAVVPRLLLRLFDRSLM